MASALRAAILRYIRLPFAQTLTLNGSKLSLCSTVRSMSSHGDDHLDKKEVKERVLDVIKSFPKVDPSKDIRLGYGIQSVALHHRYLCSSTATTDSASKSSSEANSGKGEKSGESHHQTGEQGKPVRGGPVSWLSFLLLISTGAGLIFYYDKEKKRHIEEINSASNAVKQGPSVGKAAIGGPFHLVNHEGKSVTDRDFLGKWTLIYFGFTHCPDICPDELQKLAAAVDKIKEKARIEIVPVFISVDPERDTVEQVHEYVKEFHPNLIGLTGNADEIKKVARAYRVYYMKTEEEGSDYLVDHSIIMYLMDPNMDFVKFFGKNNDVDALADGVIKEIKQYSKVKILFVSGVTLTIGVKLTLQFFMKRQHFKVSISFVVGFFFVLIGWPMFGMIVETYGFIVLFSGFWPTLAVCLQRLPILGWVLQLPFVTSFLGQNRGKRVPV